jgi:iron(III) transport system substrate-binding protein
MKKSGMGRGIATAVAVAAFAACSFCGVASAADSSNHLVLYSSMTDNDIKVLSGLLKKQFPGIEIELVNGSAGELTTRMKSEKGNPQGDMMWGGLDVADGDKHADIFEKWLSVNENVDRLPAYRSPNGMYNVDHISTVAFAVNKDLEKKLGVTIKGYQDLLNPKLKGQIIMPDPTESSSAWNNISNIMAVYGYDSPKAWEFIEGLLKNGVVISTNSSAAFNSVEDGEYAVGLTYEDGIAAILKNGATHTRLVYPAEGTSASAFGTAVVKGAPHEKLAKKVIDYIMSPEGQVAFAQTDGTVRVTTSRPYTLKWLPPTSDIKWVDRDVKWLTANRAKIVAHWTQLYTKYHR